MARLTRYAPLLLGSLLIPAHQASSQTTVSVQAGVNLATLGGDDVESADSRTGMSLGGAVTFGVAPNLGVQIGGAFSQKGATESEQGVDVTFALDYIDVPVLLRLGLPSSGAISPHFMLGPAFSVKVGCKVEGSAQGVTASVSCSDADIPIKSLDVGGMAGAGLGIATPGPVSITLDVLFNLGLTTVDDSSPAEDVKNRAWSILAGAAFPIG